MSSRTKIALAILAAISSPSMAQESTEIKKDNEPEIILVTGVRSSLEAASSLKRYSDSVQDSIVAEDIGKFPDQNVAESLQRIPGVSIDRVNGEGSKVTVRGFGPEFNVVTLNGRILATSEIGRSFDFQVLAAELISGADVIKSPTASTPEGSIGAYVNVKTARPLDNPGLHVLGSINAKYSDLSGEVSPEYSGLFSNTFADDTFGFNIAISHQESDNRYDSMGTTRWLLLNNEPGVIEGDIHNESGNVITPSTLRHAGRIEYALGQEHRERFGINTSLQWSPDSSFTNTFDYMYTDLSVETQTQGLQAGLQYPNWRNVVASENGTILSGTKFSGATLGGAGENVDFRIDGLFQVLESKSKTQAFGFNSVKEFDVLTLELDVSHSTSKSTPRTDLLVPNYISPDMNDSLDFDFRNTDTVNLDTTIDYASPSSVRAHWNQISHYELEDTITEVQTKGKYLLDLEFFESLVLDSVDFGIAYSDREKVRERYETFHEDNCGLVVPGADICGELRDMPDDIFSASPYSDFLSNESGNFPRDFIFADIDKYHAAISEMTKNPNWPNEQYNETASSSVTETTLSAYTQFNLSGIISDYDWRGNVGVRYVETDSTSSGYGKRRLSYTGELDNGQPLLVVEYTEPGRIETENSYDNWLPSLNFSINLSDNFLIRTAAAKVMSRPGIDDIGVQVSYNDMQAGSFSQTGGNPYLEPYQANQLDLSFEYYSDGGDAYAINFFNKDISRSIAQVTFIDPTPDVWNGSEYVDNSVSIDGYGNVSETINQKQNQAGGTISGVELAMQHNMDYLPGFLSGLGLQANYTWADTKNKNAPEIDLPGVKDPGDKLEGFAENSYNVVAYYDKNAFQARLAYNWRDDFLSSRSGVRSGGLPEHTAAYGQLDFSMSYEINEYFTVTGEAINITDERVYQYADVEERVINVQYTGPRYRIGVRAKF
ncbi:TonB-dependent receptor [Pseudoalteromonas sp. A601]|uniref:TonB-dependent receptor n=1 Tax=Pseudoalteromonas sp. A601 TaxID=1967839 RepID=UPI000B3D0417|nr:TonB-dependent receptor [Pseudoalteromonas sp. A601]OUS73601.1 TonB-dependent receptor [Pseudoalteromonas sp. A601]